MKPPLYQKIQRQISHHHIKTLTLDVFDTVIFNEYWPENLRLYDLAIKFLSVLQTNISPKISIYEIYSVRMQAKTELEQLHQPIRVDLWLDTLIDLLTIRYEKELVNEQRLELLAALIRIELEFTIVNTRPNRRLIKQLQDLKSLHPNLKFYFVANSHFSSEQIKTLLEIMQINIFNGGVSTSDLNASKQNGEIYEMLNAELSRRFDLTHNLHIGDERIADYLMPISHDGYAIHYRPIRMRGLRTLVGQTWTHILHRYAIQLEKRHFEKFEHENWQAYGAATASLYKKWGLKIYLATELKHQENFLLIGENADKIMQLSPKLREANNLKISNELTLETIIQAFIYLLATYQTTRWNSAELLRLLAAEASFTTREQLYQVAFEDSYIYSKLAIGSFTDKEFWSVFLNEVTNAEPQYTKKLRLAYEQVLKALPQDQKKFTIIHQNNNKSAMLMRELARLHNVPNEFDDLVLDNTGLLARCEKAISHRINTRHRDYIATGNQRAYTPIFLNDDQYLEAFVQPKLKKLAKTLK